MSDQSDPTPAVPPGSPLPVFLSTEHWSLLGTRSMTWSEVMSRITIHLTVVSAFLVVLALTVQVTGFGTPFRVMAIGLATAALVMGSLTSVRVNLASREDADLVRAMNRVRHAYVDLVPELAPYLPDMDDLEDELASVAGLDAPAAEPAPAEPAPAPQGHPHPSPHSGLGTEPDGGTEIS